MDVWNLVMVIRQITLLVPADTGSGGWCRAIWVACARFTSGTSRPDWPPATVIRELQQIPNVLHLHCLLLNCVPLSAVGVSVLKLSL